MVIFKGNFLSDLSGFLDYIVVWLGPWFGIYIVDYILRLGKYDVRSLAARRGGLYWRRGGFNWKALVSFFLGGTAAMMWIDAKYYNPSYTSPLSSSTHGADLSWLFGLVVGAVVYYLLSFSTIPNEAKQGSHQSERRG